MCNATIHHHVGHTLYRRGRKNAYPQHYNLFHDYNMGHKDFQLVLQMKYSNSTSFSRNFWEFVYFFDICFELFAAQLNNDATQPLLGYLF